MMYTYFVFQTVEPIGYVLNYLSYNERNMVMYAINLHC